MRCFCSCKMEGPAYVHLTWFWSIIEIVKGEYCGKLDDKEYYCEEGQCCGDFKCCTYYRYYEMWWFWLIWIIIILLGCSCAYYRRNHMGPYARLSQYWYSIIQPVPVRTAPVNQPDDNPSFKLPSYEEAIRMPELGPPEDNEGAPPPYAGIIGQSSNCMLDNFATSLHSSEDQVCPEGNPPEYSPVVATQSNS